MQLLHHATAYCATITSCLIRGNSHPPSLQLLHLQFSHPRTIATLTQSPDLLTLETPDQTSLPLILSLPLSHIPPSQLLTDLHTGLLGAVASLRATLLHAGVITTTPPSDMQTSICDDALFASGRQLSQFHVFRSAAATTTHAALNDALELVECANRAARQVAARNASLKEARDGARRAARRRIEHVTNNVQKERPSLFRPDSLRNTKPPSLSQASPTKPLHANAAVRRKKKRKTNSLV